MDSFNSARTGGHIRKEFVHVLRRCSPHGARKLFGSDFPDDSLDGGIREFEDIFEENDLLANALIELRLVVAQVVEGCSRVSLYPPRLGF